MTAEAEVVVVIAEAVVTVTNIKIGVTRQSGDLPLPRYATLGSSGLDIYANESVDIPPMGVAMVGSGLSVEIPVGYEIQVRSRSGLAAKNGVFVLNSPGTIDADYRGEIKVILANFSKELYKVNRLDRIAQLIPAHVVRADFALSDTLSETERGDGGFGHTGE
ncbi:dUTP diphosphatase [bacterium]|nr:dUTP diphosphatase [bacterium]